MAYVAKIIGPDERLIGVARLHWIYLAYGIGWFLLLNAVGLAADYYLYTYFGSTAPLFNQEILGISFGSQTPVIMVMCFVASLVMLSAYVIKVIATEVALTSRRVIIKEGLIAVEVEEIELEEIKGERIDHGILGQFLKFGSIHFDCRFIGDVYLPAIRKPYRFIKAMHTARSKLEDAYLHQLDPTQAHIRVLKAKEGDGPE